MSDLMRHLLRKKIVPAVLSILFGAVLIIAGREALDLMVKVAGWFLIAGAVGLVALYFFRPDRDPSNAAITWPMAGMAALAGFVLIHFAGAVVDFFPILMGVSLVLNGLSNLAEAAVDRENRILSGVIGVLVVIFGLLIVARRGVLASAMVIYMGIFLVLSGIMDLWLLHTVKRELL